MASSRLGRPRKQVNERYVSCSLTLTQAQIRWLDEIATAFGEGSSASAVVRGALRHAHAQLNSGELTREQFEAIAK